MNEGERIKEKDGLEKYAYFAHIYSEEIKFSLLTAFDPYERKSERRPWCQNIYCAVNIYDCCKWIAIIRMICWFLRQLVFQ